MADVAARTRGGVNPRITASATAKDSPAWRAYRDALSDYWTIYRLSFKDAWAIHKSYWEMFKAECSEREWQRRGLALDVGPERMVYTSWQRDENLRPLPQVGYRDVTPHVLQRFGQNIGMLIGHDPGSLQDASVMLKAYKRNRSDVIEWWVVDELRTKQTTSQEHARALLEHLQQKWNIQWQQPEEPKCLVRCDPYGDNDSKVDRSVYLTFREFTFNIMAAAYKNGKPGRIPKEAGIEMVNRLFCNAKQERRLFIAQDERGKPCAPLLVEAIELNERDGDGKAETSKKTHKGPGGDLSDFPAALRYALWQIERVRNRGTFQGSVVG
jgi:hypothetical protein